MKPWNLYKYQKQQDYIGNSADYDWCVKVNDDEKIIYVFSQFSTTVLDWIVNIVCFAIPQIRHWFIYFASIGWQTAFNSCKGMMMNRVLSEMNNHPDYKVVCCGHSYGGAGSVLVGIEIYFQSGKKPYLTTFGAPKPLVFFISALAARFFFKEVKQYAHRADIVTYMPPLPGYWNIKVIRIGQFSFKALFDIEKTHHCYGDESLYSKVV